MAEPGSALSGASHYCSRAWPITPMERWLKHTLVEFVLAASENRPRAVYNEDAGLSLYLHIMNIALNDVRLSTCTLFETD